MNTNLLLPHASRAHHCSTNQHQLAQPSWAMKSILTLLISKADEGHEDSRNC
jgi:hypothetical protein